MDTSFLSEINWLAVLAATFAYFGLGAVWYTALFGKQWVEYQKIDPNDPELKKGSGAIMLTTVLMIAVAVFALAILVERMELTETISGLKLGLLTGLAFAFTALSISYLYVKKPFALHLIDGMYHVVGHVLAAIILCAWQ